MKPQWRLVGASLAFAMMAQSAAAEPRPVTVLAKGDGTLAERAADVARCTAIADRAPSADLPRSGGQASAMGYGGYYGSVEGAIGSGIAMLIIAAIETERARGQAATFCMANLGYAEVPLTAEEAAVYLPLRGARREEWEGAFMVGAGERVAAIRTPRVPALPGYRSEPGTLGGLKFDIASLTASSGPAAVGLVLASGGATRWRTAEVVEPLETSHGGFTLLAEPGAVFHQVDFRPQAEPLLRDQGATWCGPVVEATSQSRSTQVWCFTHHYAGYTAFRPTGYAWQAGAYRDGIYFAGVQDHFILREREADDLQLAYDIRVSAINNTSVTLEGVVRNGARSVAVWRQVVSMRAGEKVTLPLWARRLTISRDRTSLTAELDDNGNGSGPRA